MAAAASTGRSHFPLGLLGPHLPGLWFHRFSFCPCAGWAPATAVLRVTWAGACGNLPTLQPGPSCLGPGQRRPGFAPWKDRHREWACVQGAPAAQPTPRNRQAPPGRCPQRLASRRPALQGYSPHVWPPGTCPLSLSSLGPEPAGSLWSPEDGAPAAQRPETHRAPTGSVLWTVRRRHHLTHRCDAVFSQCPSGWTLAAEGAHRARQPLWESTLLPRESWGLSWALLTQSTSLQPSGPRRKTATLVQSKEHGLGCPMGPALNTPSSLGARPAPPFRKQLLEAYSCLSLQAVLSRAPWAWASGTRWRCSCRSCSCAADASPLRTGMPRTSCCPAGWDPKHAPWTKAPSSSSGASDRPAPCPTPPPAPNKGMQLPRRLVPG